MSAVAKLQCLFGLVQENWPHGSVGLLQAWLVAPRVHPQQTCPILFADPCLVVGNAAFTDFRLKSCNMPLQLSTSMPGRVWCTGAVQIIQNVLIIPPRLHPRTSLSDDDARNVSELVYMPVYDLSVVSGHPVAVLEVLFTTSSSQTLLMADFISFIGETLTQLQMSFTNPCPAPGGCGGTLVSRRADGGAAARGRPRHADDGDSDSQVSASSVDQERLQMACLAVSDSASSGFSAQLSGRASQAHCSGNGGQAYSVIDSKYDHSEVRQSGAAAVAAPASCCGGAAMRRVRSVAKFGGVPVLSHGGGGMCAMS